MKSISINQAIVRAGENQVIKVPVGNIPSGNKINVHINVYRAEVSGPTVLILGGVHGDEINGIEIVRRAIASGIFNHLQKGSVIAIPILNIFGFINFSREVPNGKDVNRSFPGSPKGSLASRVAHILTKQIIPHIDFGVDFHTGGRSLHNYPQIRYTKNDDQAMALAKTFAAPYTIAKSAIDKSLRKVARSMEKPILVFEGGESLRYDGLSIDVGLKGVRRLLKYHEMLKGAYVAKQESIFIDRTSWLRAPHAGTFLWYKSSGNEVKQGEPLGEINDPQGLKKTTVVAHQSGYIVGHNNAPVISQGDALFHIGG